VARIVALAALLVSAGFVVFSPDLLISALFLGLSSVAASIVYYSFGAVQASLVELSIGAGLTTIIFIITITLSGVSKMQARAARTRTSAFIAAAAVLVCMAYAMMNTTSGQTIQGAAAMAEVSDVLWKNRVQDVWGMVFIIIAAGIGVATLFRPGGETK
jgi:NADH-quinone oxidoreductase subunit J